MTPEDVERDVGSNPSTAATTGTCSTSPPQRKHAFSFISELAQWGQRITK